MKKQLLAVISLCLFSVLFSCTKSPSSNTTNTDALTYMNANVSLHGRETPLYWTSDLTLGHQQDTAVDIGGTKSSNSHTGTAGQALGIHFHNYTPTTGTFNIDGVNISAYWQNAGTSTHIPAVSGSITIDTASTQFAAGSFSFLCSDTTTITGGRFSVSW